MKSQLIALSIFASFCCASALEAGVLKIYSVSPNRQKATSNRPAVRPAQPAVRKTQSRPVIRPRITHYNPGLYYGLRNSMNSYYGANRNGYRQGNRANFRPVVRKVVRRPDQRRTAAQRYEEQRRARIERTKNQMSHRFRR